MTFDEIFEAYYNLYRLEAETPASADDEYTIALRLANEGVRRWASYDATYWRELFTTLQEADDGDKIVTSSLTYDAPSDMQQVGGYVKIIDSLGNIRQRIKIIEPQEAQFRSDSARYCYFTGDPNNGFVLHLHPSMDTAVIGMSLDYIYYKKATLFTTGDDVTEMAEPYFCVHRMLANRFRGSRNPYYGSAKTDAEDVLKTMKMANDSGSWANPWSLADNSGTSWGQ